MKTYPVSAKYNKLVRDRIPEIIEANGGLAVTKTLSREEVIGFLKEKLVEEARELEGASNLEEIKDELADVLEVFYALLEEYDFDLTQIEQIRNEKADKRGGFKKRIFLIETREGK